MIWTSSPMTRRRFLGSAAGLGAAGFLGGASWKAQAAANVTLPFVNGERPMTEGFPQKAGMILQRSRPPQLETPFEVYDRGVFTPNDQFYVRWHLANIPTEIDPASYRLKVHGHVGKTVEFTLDELATKFERVEIVAVNQCSGNSRGFFAPRVPGAQWANGAMGNARWTGVRLREVLDAAGVSPGAVAVRCTGLDAGVIPATPQFRHSLSVDHARDGEVMIAYMMNGEPLPLLNGYPIRLIVPGWFAPYWVKMLSDIEVLDQADDDYWMAKAYRIPDNPQANVAPGVKDFATVPINRLVPRSFVTNVGPGTTAKAGATFEVRGIAFGGDNAVAHVKVSTDGGRSWEPTLLGVDHGKYSFRQWNARLRFAKPGLQQVMCMATNSAGIAQPAVANWNAGGFMRNVIESVAIQVS